MLSVRRLLILLSILLSSGAVCAEELSNQASAWSFPASISVVSDYIFRGQTQTWGQPALQLGVEADHQSGFYAGFWGSNVTSDWLPGASLEADISAGFRKKFASGLEADVGGTYIYYPGANFSQIPNAHFPSTKLNSFELYINIRQEFWTVKAGYMPTQYFGWNANNTSVGSSFAGNPQAGVTGDTRGAYYYSANINHDWQSLNVGAEIGRQIIPNTVDLDWTWYKFSVGKNLSNDWSVGAFYTGTFSSHAYAHFVSLDSPNQTHNIDANKLVLTLTKNF
jgi:uncharacterized protein (TIGR02001 family)